MLPAALLKNPLASGLGGLAAVLAIVAGVQTLRLAWSEAEVHREQLAFANFKTELANETLRLEREAKTRSDAAIVALTAEMRSVGQAATQVKTEIRLVQSDGGPCRTDPAYRAGLDGVRRVLRARGAGGD